MTKSKADPEKKIEKKLGIRFKNPNLAQNSVVHRSYLNENPDFPLPSNERLEFLGDAVLEQIVSNYLYHNFPALPEGELTALRAALVRTESLAEEARRLGLGEELLLSKGEESGGGRDNPYLLANTFEAVVGATFLDQGLPTAIKFVERELLYKTEESLKSGTKDPKSQFQELSQAKLGVTPTYRVIKEWGPAHNRQFICGAYVKKKKVAEGQGRSKKEAEESAATQAFNLLSKEGAETKFEV